MEAQERVNEILTYVSWEAFDTSCFGETGDEVPKRGISAWGRWDAAQRDVVRFFNGDFRVLHGHDDGRMRAKEEGKKIRHGHNGFLCWAAELGEAWGSRKGQEWTG